MMGVIMEESAGDAETNALPTGLNAVAEGKYSTTLLGSGAAKTHLALGKEALLTRALRSNFGMVSGMTTGRISAPTAPGSR